jgi:predicted enzyme related to lactoylglutathione lyase
MREDFRTGRTPIFFTKKIGKMRDVMTARGVAVGSIERDRQGIQYFQIHDPEGNEIEVVQES